MEDVLSDTLYHDDFLNRTLTTSSLYDKAHMDLTFADNNNFTGQKGTSNISDAGNEAMNTLPETIDPESPNLDFLKLGSPDLEQMFINLQDESGFEDCLSNEDEGIIKTESIPESISNASFSIEDDLISADNCFTEALQQLHDKDGNNEEIVPLDILDITVKVENEEMPVDQQVEPMHYHIPQNETQNMQQGHQNQVTHQQQHHQQVIAQKHHQQQNNHSSKQQQNQQDQQQSDTEDRKAQRPRQKKPHNMRLNILRPNQQLVNTNIRTHVYSKKVREKNQFNAHDQQKQQQIQRQQQQQQQLQQQHHHLQQQHQQRQIISSFNEQLTMNTQLTMLNAQQIQQQQQQQQQQQEMAFLAQTMGYQHDQENMHSTSVMNNSVTHSINQIPPHLQQKILEQHLIHQHMNPAYLHNDMNNHASSFQSIDTLTAASVGIDEQTLKMFVENPHLAPINLEVQELIKRERKKLRNRIASSKCRKRKLEREGKLEDKVRNLKEKNIELNAVANALKQQICDLKQKVMDHVGEGCQVIIPS